MKVVLNLNAPIRGELTINAEAVAVEIPGFPFATNCYATPHIDDEEGVTDLWDITEGETGFRVTQEAADSIEGAILSAAFLMKKKRVDSTKWKTCIINAKRSLAERAHAKAS